MNEGNIWFGDFVFFGDVWEGLRFFTKCMVVECISCPPTKKKKNYRLRVNSEMTFLILLRVATVIVTSLEIAEK
jgi:hypothetical protein